MNTPHVRYQSGSGLLITILTLAGFSSVALLGTAVFLASARQSSRNTAALVADQMAQQGIQEGLLRYSQDNGTDSVLVKGEYGEGAVSNAQPNNAVPYSLLPLRRGYTGADCATASADASMTASVADPTCPYVDTAIRNTVSLAQGIRYLYTPELIASPLTVRVKKYAEFVVSKTTSAGQGIVQVCDTAGTCRSVTLTTASPRVTVTQNYVGSGLNIDHLVLSESGDATLAVAPDSNAGTSQLAIEKGFTTIESTGYAGGIQQKLVMNILAVPNDLPKYRVYHSSQTYNSGGCLNSGNPSDSSTCLAR